MKKILSIFALSAMMLLSMGCDKIDPDHIHKPYEPMPGYKTVLIKDFTGVKCKNCPAAAEALHLLQQQLGEDRVLVMSVHAGELAYPTGKFPDFRTEEGTLWYNNNLSNPLFSVDHVALTEGNTLTLAEIDKPVRDGLVAPQLFEIYVFNTYDEATRLLTVENYFVPDGDGNGKYFATVCLLEDSIVGRQAIPTGIDTAYVFRNVFRGTLNGVNGTLISDGPFYIVDQFDPYTCSTVLDSTYNADQCYILTYIYDEASGEIIQSQMAKVIDNYDYASGK